MQTILTSREFNQDASGAKRAAKEGPVFITDRGRPAHVLLSIEEYQRLTAGPGSIIDLLAMPGVEDIEFEAPRAQGLSRPADLA
ncbi:MAG: type II toxin-antitoxin system Phd/YefM family antitoxin [Gammaproteobacteria bacterium]|nr:type II toxin-antitoxin system Phd/YefM family antitoxin [Gammaproteobacteria bacterium]MBU1490779.1 type II toxin-antitoxin system Phd/YefM family antitoxin [Gammaproteobacteria bacterium]MBU2065555.1 type II toxin-antitoxin system Phd/YefM family antitoxin [Gammaproteobacteria bacterium]MBU2140810.1 type II toxin-antitoxin system Phd/YefM family antitoxin [Gammaproteobacteria bacterium]MBU2217301.1 type II toxin-antitoxin system Phd/YefM family antitoxin [Gammaproteobacteria bacterium]